MFEQAVLPERPAAGRYWALMIGATGEALLVAFVLIAPLIWPQLLPRAMSLTWLTLPTPLPAAVKTSPPAHVRPARAWQMIGEKLIQPASIPDRVAVIEDPPASSSGVDGGVVTSDLAGLAMGVLNATTHIAPPVRAADPPIATPVKPAATEIPRHKIGGLVHMARIVRRVDPIYPPIARQARILGTVELTGVIGIDGHIRELQVVRGHPLLTKAALDAVRQWVYEPTLLNGEPVEVIAPITVNFRLN